MPRNPLFNALPLKTRKQTKIISYAKKNVDNSDASYPDLTPVFLTPQSLASFPGASIAVNIIWIVSAEIYRPLSNSRIVPIVAALLVGLFIYSQSSTEGLTKKEKCRAIFIAFLNSLYIAAVALGLNIGTPPNSGGT